MTPDYVGFFSEINNAACPEHVRRELNRRAMEALQNADPVSIDAPLPEEFVTVTVDKNGNILP